eukprot:scaffold139601_cov17-Tisochrysis_lutea.AAC.1
MPDYRLRYFRSATLLGGYSNLNETLPHLTSGQQCPVLPCDLTSQKGRIGKNQANQKNTETEEPLPAIICKRGHPDTYCSSSCIGIRLFLVTGDLERMY